MTEITFKYITNSETTETVTVKDVIFAWNQVYWEEKRSIGGKTFNDTRGFEAVLELQFEHNDQLLSVANNINNTVANEGVVQYVVGGRILPVVAESAVINKDYIYQIAKKPSTLLLKGNIQDDTTFIITGILCGDLTATCGQTDILCGA